MSEPNETKATTASKAEEKATTSNVASTNENDDNSTIQKSVKIIPNSTLSTKIDLEEIEVIKETEKVKPNSIIFDFTSKCNFATLTESNIGKNFIIDVQPDTRYITSVIISEINRNFSMIDVKSLRYITEFSLVSYSLIIYYSAILLLDINHARGFTAQTQNWNTEHKRQQLLNLLKDCVVPEFLIDCIKSLAPMNDTKNERLQLLPSFSAAIFPHDYGRLIPASLFFIMHNIIATCRVQQNPQNLIDILMSTQIATYNNHDYYVTNILCGPALIGNQPSIYYNWFYNKVTSIFVPGTFRTMLVRFGLSQFKVTPPTSQNEEFAYYDYLLGFNDENFMHIKNLCLEVNDVTRQIPDFGKTKLIDVLNAMDGIQIGSHTIEPHYFTTWHSFPPTPVGTDQNITTTRPISVTTLYENGRLFPPYTAGTHTGPTPVLTVRPPPSPTPSGEFDEQQSTLREPMDVSHLYLVSNISNLDPRVEHFDYMTRTDPNSFEGDCYLFQPYQTRVEDAKYTIANGIKIENLSFDAFSTFIPTPKDALGPENNRFLIGAITADSILPMSPNPNRTNTQILSVRQRRESSDGPLNNGLILRTTRSNIYPQFNITRVHQLLSRPSGYSYSITNEINRANNYYSTQLPASETRTRKKHLWSSYRWLEDQFQSPSNPWLFSTMRNLYGTRVPSIRLPPPYELLPS
jgi:hypothetical protein